MLMTKDQQFFIALLSLLTVLPVLLHALRGRLTLGPFFGLSGVYSIMLWQLLQTGWWVNWRTMHFNTGLTLFVPVLLFASLMTFAFDGLRTARAFIGMVVTTCLIAWFFSWFRESLSAYVPLPYFIILSAREHMAIIAALFVSQWLGMMVYSGFRRWNFLIALP